MRQSPSHGYQILEVTIDADSPAAGHTLGETTWPPGWVPVSVLDDHTLRDPDPGLTLAPGDRINLLAPALPGPGPKLPPDDPGAPPGPAREAPAPPTGEQP